MPPVILLFVIMLFVIRLFVILNKVKNLIKREDRSFAALRMTRRLSFFYLSF